MCFLEQLEDEEVQTRVAGCAALGCLKVRDVERRQQSCMFQGKRKLNEEEKKEDEGLFCTMGLQRPLLPSPSGCVPAPALTAKTHFLVPSPAGQGEHRAAGLPVPNRQRACAGGSQAKPDAVW